MIRKTQPLYVIALIGVLFLMAAGGCETNPTGNNNNNNNTNTGPQAVATAISVHVQAAIQAGDDLVVYGTGGATGVDYIIPSEADTAGRGIPDADTFTSSGFAVAGRNIFLTDGSFQITVFNVDSETSTTFPVTDIRLKNIPVSPHDVGNIQADGDLCAVICEETDVTDGEILKVIDTSSGTPELIVLTECPVATAEQVQQVAVNGATRQVVVSAGNNLYLFDVDSPGDLPLLMTAHADGIGDTQMAFDGESILYYTDAATPSAVVFDLGANDNALFAANPAAGTLAHRGGAFGYFLNDDSIGNHLRSSIGQLGDATAATATATNATIDDFIDGATTNNGAIGHGQTISILPDGSQWFIAGLESIGSGEYLQTSTGGAFTTVADPSGTDELGCPASDVNCSANTVAFKYGTGTTTFVAYIRMN